MLDSRRNGPRPFETEQQVTLLMLAQHFTVECQNLNAQNPNNTEI